MIRVMMRAFGVPGAVLVLTSASVVLSVLITHVVSWVTHHPVTSIGLSIAIIAPAAIAPLFSSLQLSALHRLDVAEQRLRELSTTDELTRAYNRRHILELAEAERIRAQRSGRPLSIALLDVDGFKAINDTHGHAGGDAVLQQLAAICRGHARASDYFARFGGEEFMFVLPDTDSSSATEFASRLRAALAATSVNYCGRPIVFTVSIGIATLTHEDIGSLVLRADNALYAAKRSGKNRLIVAEDAMPGMAV